MALYTWRVTPDEGEPYIVNAGTRDVLAWEKGNPGRSAQQMQDDFHMSYAYWLAHHAAKRQGLFSGTRQEFEQSVDLESGTLVEVPGDDGDGDGADPT